MLKENLIMDIITDLVDKIGVENTNKVKEELELKLNNVEFVKKETSLVLNQNETAMIVRKFIACKQLQGLTQRTLKAYLTELANFFKKIKKNVKDISSDDIRFFLADARKTANNITVDNKRRYLNSFFEWAETEEIINKNPVKKIDKIKAPKKVKESFTDVEIEMMRNELQNKKYYDFDEYANLRKLRNIAIFELLLSSGMRVAELVSVNRYQVSNDESEITILGKGNKERKVYLNAKANIAINNYLNARKDKLDCLFVGYGNKGLARTYKSKESLNRIDISSVEGMIRNLGKRLNIEAYPHKFRRTVATMAVKKGMPIEQVQKILGHATLNTTQIYVNVDENQVKMSHERLFN